MAGLVFETLDAGVTDNGDDCWDIDALLTLLKEPEWWTVPEGSAQEQPDDKAPLLLMYDPLRPMSFADTEGT